MCWAQHGVGGPSSPPLSLRALLHAPAPPLHSLVTGSLGRRLDFWAGGSVLARSPWPGSRPPLPLGALGAEEVGADPGVLSLWGEAAVELAPAPSTQQTVTCGEKTPSPQEGWSGGSPQPAALAAQLEPVLKRQATAVPRALAGLRMPACGSALRTPPGRPSNSQVGLHTLTRGGYKQKDTTLPALPTKFSL